MNENLIVWYQTKHKCGHTSKMHCAKGSIDDEKDEIARLESINCKKCWMKENGYTHTFDIRIPKGL